MSHRSKKEYPFKVYTFLPKGHKLGLRNRESMRYSFHKTKDEADREAMNWRGCGLKSIVHNRNEKK